MRLLPVVLVMTVWSAPAWADGVDPRIAYLSRQLHSGQDVRVRAQAALVLGRSEEAAALEPLCSGLRDPSEVVRGAAARGIEELAELAGLPCLEGARGDSDESVRAAVVKARTTLATIRDREPWLYLSLRPVKVAASFERELGALAEGRLRRQLQHLGTRWAPEEETRKVAKQVMAKQKLVGFTLVPELFEHGEKGLRLKVLCMSYPDERLLGEVEVRASGGRPADLVKALVPRAITEMTALFEESRN